MNLLNENIKHTAFGNGQIIQQEENRVSIQFTDQDSVKKFVYPDAFETHLKLNNEALANEMREEFEKKRMVAVAEKARKQQAYEDELKMKIEEKSKAKPTKRVTKKKQ